MNIKTLVGLSLSVVFENHQNNLVRSVLSWELQKLLIIFGI